jgi:CRP-like cAMP-binding protein
MVMPASGGFSGEITKIGSHFDGTTNEFHHRIAALARLHQRILRKARPAPMLPDGGRAAPSPRDETMPVAPASAWRYPCAKCPLRTLAAFRKFTAEELEFVASFKSGELTVEPGTTILAEGSQSAHLYTVLAGWGFRYKLLEDGRRQILNFVLPGDFVGIQASVLSEMQHSVEALTSALLCVFERDRIWELYRSQPSLAFDMTWLAAREEQMLDEHLLNIGQRTAEERAAYLLLFLVERAEVRAMAKGNRVSLPLTQPHVADSLGLSLVHTNRVLNRLARHKMIALKKGEIEVIDRKSLSRAAQWEPSEPAIRPFI